jgi:hypothetical protein
VWGKSARHKSFGQTNPFQFSPIAPFFPTFELGLECRVATFSADKNRKHVSRFIHGETVDSRRLFFCCMMDHARNFVTSSLIVIPCLYMYTYEMRIHTVVILVFDMERPRKRNAGTEPRGTVVIDSYQCITRNYYHACMPSSMMIYSYTTPHAHRPNIYINVAVRRSNPSIISPKVQFRNPDVLLRTM